MAYDHEGIETRWQAYWEDHETFRAEIDSDKPKYYVLDMFPYPSGDGLHVGHVEGYTATDIVSRYKRMRGFNVLHPMGWDAFGLPAERFAMKTGTHPAVKMAECAHNFRRQLKRLGFSYDWSREVNTTDPAYYKWTQWIFLKMWDSWYDLEQQRARPIRELVIPEGLTKDPSQEAYKEDEEAREKANAAAVRAYVNGRRLAYLEEAPVNWCPQLRIVLANEEVAEYVEQGYEVVRKPMTQWMLRITDYAERLLADLETLDWSEKLLTMQRNWIGRSEGASIFFSIRGHDDLNIEVFTTRPDTLYGATYMVLAPEHPLVEKITTKGDRDRVSFYVRKTQHRTERERQQESIVGVKTGAFTGAYAINPVNGKEIPIWIADYVLLGYGTGAIMAVPGHDERDHAFAKTFGLEIIEVVRPTGDEPADSKKEAFVGVGKAVNSGILNGLETPLAKSKMIDHLEELGAGTRQVTYKLRDWLFSRQRYWGEPFPLVHQADGTVTPVPVEDLPVTLPNLDDYGPSETGEPPLSKATDWVDVGGGAHRETNTMPQWAGSCWYYLRYCDPRNDTAPIGKEADNYWLPVDLYVGGVEHAVSHLLYSRFWHKVLYDLGHLSDPEPFKRLVNQGMILGATFVPLDRRKGDDGKPVLFLPGEVTKTEGEGGSDLFHLKEGGEQVEIQWDKMSKTRGNVVNPDDVVQEFGADTLRLYEMFMGPLEQSAPWQTAGVAGIHRFLSRVWRLFFEEESGKLRSFSKGEGTDRQRKVLHRTIHDVTQRVERMTFNTAISALMVFVRDIVAEGEKLPRGAAEPFALLLSPMAPHMAEELWSALGHGDTLAYEPWPAADDAMLVEETFTLVVQVMGKKRAEIQAPEGAGTEELEALARRDEAVQRHLGTQEPKRVVVVPGKLVNFVL